MDFIVAMSGTVAWVDKVRWAGRKAFHSSPRKVINVHNILEGYYRSHGKLSFYWVNRAGHMVATDNPKAMSFILRRTTKYDQN